MIEVSTQTRSTLVRSLLRAAPWGALLAFAGLVAFYSSRYPREGLALAAGVLVASILALRAQRADGASSLRWIPVAWVLLFLVAEHRFDVGRSPLEAATGNASFENILEIAVYALVAAMTLRSRRMLVRRSPSRIPKVPIVLFPLFAIASTLWSPIPLFTLIRSLQLFVVVSLALLTIRIWRFSAEMGQSIWTGTLRLLVQAVTVLSLIGFIVHIWPDDRFAWPGLLPGAASIYVGVAFLILVVGGRSLAPRPKWAYWPRLCLFAAAIYLGQTRSVLAALTVAGLAAVWILGREKVHGRYFGILYFGVGVLLVFLVARTPVVDYLARGERSGVFSSLNGRVPLWELAIQEVSQAGKWLVGFGYGSPRILLYPKVSWAGTAHSSWIEVLMGVGIIGALLFAADLIYLTWRLVWVSDASRSTRLAFVILVFLFVISGTSEILVLPSIGFGLLALIHCPALGPQRWPYGVGAHPPSNTTREARGQFAAPNRPRR